MVQSLQGNMDAAAAVVNVLVDEGDAAAVEDVRV